MAKNDKSPEPKVEPDTELEYDEDEDDLDLDAVLGGFALAVESQGATIADLRDEVKHLLLVAKMLVTQLQDVSFLAFNPADEPEDRRLTVLREQSLTRKRVDEVNRLVLASIVAREKRMQDSESSDEG